MLTTYIANTRSVYRLVQDILYRWQQREAREVRTSDTFMIQALQFQGKHFRTGGRGGSQRELAQGNEQTLQLDTELTDSTEQESAELSEVESEAECVNPAPDSSLTSCPPTPPTISHANDPAIHLPAEICYYTQWHASSISTDSPSKEKVLLCWLHHQFGEE